jgi:hypothetical protein
MMNQLYQDRLLHHTEYLIPYPSIPLQTGKDAFISKEHLVMLILSN